MSLTITEALAEIKTIAKRIEKKREFIRSYLYRPENQKDPLAKDGSSSLQAIASEQQGIRDLEERIVTLRRGIQQANEQTMVTIAGTSRSIADWLVWRREAAPLHSQFLGNLRTQLNQLRSHAQNKGAAIINAAVVDNNSKPTDIIVNIDEVKLAAEIEAFENTLGQLDGVLSLKNATVTIND